ncbi:unnamed protein product [Ixodes pacificus]
MAKSLRGNMARGIRKYGYYGDSCLQTVFCMICLLQCDPG